MRTPYILVRDINGYNGFGLPFPLDKYSATLTSGGGEKTLTAPTDGNDFIAIFSYESGATVWVANNATAEVPTGASFAATTSELNPSERKVSAGDVLHFITADTSADVGVVFYALQ